MKILILGGTRFFGRLVAEALTRKGHQVTAFSRTPPTPEFLREILLLRGDRKKPSDLRKLAEMGPWDAVLDNICYSAQDAEMAIQAFQDRARRWVFTSSLSVYSCLSRISNPLTEDQIETFPENPALRKEADHRYAFGKLDAERTYVAAYKKHRFPIVILRPTVILGADDPTLRANSYWKRILDGQPILLPDEGKNFLRLAFAPDVARLARLMLTVNLPIEGEAFNAASEETVSLREWLELSAALLGQKSEFVDVPSPWLKKQGFNFAASPYSWEQDYIPEIAKTKKTFDWVPNKTTLWTRELVIGFLREQSLLEPPDYSQRSKELGWIRMWRGEKT